MLVKIFYYLPPTLHGIFFSYIIKKTSYTIESCDIGFAIVELGLYYICFKQIQLYRYNY